MLRDRGMHSSLGSTGRLPLFYPIANPGGDMLLINELAVWWGTRGGGVSGRIGDQET